MFDAVFPKDNERAVAAFTTINWYRKTPICFRRMAMQLPPTFLYVCAVVHTAPYAQGWAEYYLLEARSKAVCEFLWIGGLLYCALFGTLTLWIQQVLYTWTREPHDIFWDAHAVTPGSTLLAGLLYYITGIICSGDVCIT